MDEEKVKRIIRHDVWPMLTIQACSDIFENTPRTRFLSISTHLVLSIHRVLWFMAMQKFVSIMIIPTMFQVPNIPPIVGELSFFLGILQV